MPAAPRHWRRSLRRLNATLFTPDRGTPSLEACLRGIDEGRFYGPWREVPAGWYTPLPPPSAEQQAEDKELRALLTALNEPLETALVIKSMAKVVPYIAFNSIFPTLDACRNASSER